MIKQYGARDRTMNATHENDQAGEYVNDHYRKVAARWRERVTDSPFMQQLTLIRQKK
jgi:hypothetical protein